MNHFRPQEAAIPPSSAPVPRLSVVVPAHNARGEIDAVLDALLTGGFAAEEILVVDDGSRDGTGAHVRARGIRVLRNETALQPANARNRGVEAVEGDVVVFVDADVVIHPGARERIEAAFADPGLAALFGSYDDRPPAPALVSRYRNLLHHFVHQRANPEATTFWTGFGAVRRDVFRARGGLDRAWQNIEDVEFGLRVSRAGGRIRLDRGLLCTHLKAWTWRSMWRTDLWGRAVPWSRLMLSGAWGGGDLNATAGHKVSAGAVAFGAAGLVVAPVVPEALAVAGLAGLAFLGANAAFLAFLARTGGVGLALGALPAHVAHYAAALLGLAWVVLHDYLRPRLGLRAEARSR